VSKSGIKQPHLPQKHIAFYLFAVLYPKKKKKEEPKSRHTVIPTVQEEEAGPSIMNIPLSLEHIWVPLSYDT